MKEGSGLERVFRLSLGIELGERQPRDIPLIQQRWEDKRFVR